MTDIRDVGDWRAPTISISTAAGTPALGTVTCSVEDPDGVVMSVAMTAGAPTATATPWTGDLYELTKAGEWIERFTITGDGRGKARQRVWVQSDPGATPSGMRVYATTGDYANSPYGTTVPDEAVNMRRALLIASARIDEMTSALYDTDSVTLLPTDTAVAAILRDATVAQAAYALETGDPYGFGVQREQSVSIGSVSLSRGSTAGGATDTPGRYSPQAREILRAGGLTGGMPLGIAWVGGVL